MLMGKISLVSRLVRYANYLNPLAHLHATMHSRIQPKLAITYINDEGIGPFVSAIPVVVESEAKQASLLRRLLSI